MYQGKIKAPVDTVKGAVKALIKKNKYLLFYDWLHKSLNKLKNVPVFFPKIHFELLASSKREKFKNQSSVMI